MSGDVEMAAVELRQFLKLQPHERVDAATFPALLKTIGLGWPDRDVQLVTDVQAVINEVISDIRDDESRRAIEALAGDGPERYLSFKTRGTRAGAVRGVRYDAYRRSGSGRLNGDLLLLSRAMTARVAPETGEPAVVESSANVDDVPATSIPPEQYEVVGRRGLPLGWIGAFALVGIVVLVASFGGPSAQSDETAAGDAPIEDTPVEAGPAPDAVDAESSVAPNDGGSDSPPAVDDALLASSAAGLGCSSLGQVASSDPDVLAAASAIASSGLAFDRDTCPVGEVAQRGTAFWQRVERNGRLDGGVVAYQDDAEAFEIVRLNAGQWQSYIRVGGGDGSRSTSLAGHPTGEVVEANGLFELVVTGDVLLVAEHPSGTYYWLPGVAVEAWQDDLRSGDPKLGAPTSSLYIDAGAFRVDFERGHMYQTVGGVIAIVVAEIEERRPPDGVEPGSVISSIDGTAWYIDSELRRWWIRDGVAWDCVGGATGLVAEGLRGYVVHSFAYGGVLSCPIDGDSLGVWPAGGGLNLWLYCRDQFGGTAESTDEGWECIGLDRSRHTVNVDEACRWQYGPAAMGTSKPESPFGWTCRNP